MATLSRRIKQVAADRVRAVAVGLSLIGLTLLAGLLSLLLGVLPAAQVLLTLIVPAVMMVVFWRLARARLLAREAEFDAAIELEKVANRAAGEFLVGVSPEITIHPRRCNLRAEALAVAADYRRVRPELKVAVPDIAVVTDPHALRQVLHALVSNAIRHGGNRVAVWAARDEHSVRLTVSDDGSGLPPEIGAMVFERYLDLLEHSRRSRPTGTGLPVARTLSDLMGGQISYRRDPSWSHFSVSLPLAGEVDDSAPLGMPMEAGVR